DKNSVEAWFDGLRTALQSSQLNGAVYEVEVFNQGAGEGFSGKVSINTHGVELVNVFTAEFFNSIEYQNLVALENQYTLEDAVVRVGDKEQRVSSLKQAFDWMQQEAARGLYLKRYKGLGEMNPEQLWETTMDETTRSLSQVRIEDAVAADEIFTTLMGDQVEPRREFIEQNALSVENVDT
ncbi:MAG: DNA gyrase subunit B, partial [Gammaproteobacteria bacterium]|nr:DNA gyrase subunit B [Gammaproteobacteria bacterium]